MIIQHNLMSLNAHRQLGINNTAVSKNLEKLSSGYRVNRAADDAAGLAISEKMRAQITGLNRASLNAQDGISLVQTAEGALQEVHDMLNRMEELAVEAANGLFDETDRHNIQAETDSLREEIDRIAENANFNGIKLLNGDLGIAGKLTTYSPPTPGYFMNGMNLVSSSELGASPKFMEQGEGPVRANLISYAPLYELEFKVENKDMPGQYITTVVELGDMLSNKYPDQFTIDLGNFGQITIENHSISSESNSLDDIADNLAALVDGHLQDIIPLTADELAAAGLHLQIGDTSPEKMVIYINNMSTSGLELKGVSMLSEKTASKALGSIKDAINTVSRTRGNLGGWQNRLEHTIDNLGVMAENMTQAESRIRDADMAKEMMAFTKNSVLSQSAQAMLAQANTQPQQVLQLLQ